MPQFYINRGSELNARPPFSRPLTIRSCADIDHSAVPPSHIYITSRNYAGLLKQSLGEQAAQLNQLPDHDAQHLVDLPSYPKSFRNLGFGSVSELHNEVSQHSKNPKQPKFVLINGIGTGLGDNYIGLGVLQRLTKLLAPMQPEFFLMQELEERISPIYLHENSIKLSTCFMPLNEFLGFDFYIDFAHIQNMPSFDEVAAAQFNSHAFSINQLLPKSNIQPNIVTSKEKTAAIKQRISSALAKDKKTVLLHPLASSLLRKMPSHKAAEIVNALVAQNYNIVSAFEHNNPPPGFLSLAEQSKTVDDLVHIINAVDAVISVGTVTYHIASALGKPTLLLPTVLPDIRSASLLPEVLTWAPSANKPLYLNLHKSEDKKDIEVAAHIWNNVNAADAVNALSAHIARFTTRNTGTLAAPDSPPRVAVVIAHSHNTQALLKSVDSLSNVAAFDPQYLYSVEHRHLNTQHHRHADAFNRGIEQALKHGCDYIWLLHENARIPHDYLQTLLAHFSHNKSLGIIGGNDQGLDSMYASMQFKPNYLATPRTQSTGLRQPWVNFSSALIRANVFETTAPLDPTMQRLFCDTDFCIRAANNGWQTWLDPSTGVHFSNNPLLNKTDLLSQLQSSAQAFNAKWSEQLEVEKTTELEQRLLSFIGFN